MIKKLWRYTKGYRVRAALATLFVMAEVVLEVYIPYVMKDIINVGIKGNAGVAYILGKGALMLGLALTSLACGALCGCVKHGIYEESQAGAFLQGTGFFVRKHR